MGSGNKIDIDGRWKVASAVSVYGPNEDGEGVVDELLYREIINDGQELHTGACYTMIDGQLVDVVKEFDLIGYGRVPGCTPRVQM
jgi:hypothetical protein